MKKVLIIVAFFFCLSGIFAQGYNGVIEFKYANPKDTTVNIYSVKNKMVRLDQYGKKGTVEGSFIFDIAGNVVKFLNPKRKLWGIQRSETPQIVRGECVITKGTSPKTISNMKCTEYTVKNAAENTVITYWITDGKYTFFSPMLKLWNGKTKQSIYFAQIKGLPEGSMPMLSEERQLTDGKLLTRLEVTKMTNTTPDDSNFTVPEGYTKFDQ